MEDNRNPVLTIREKVWNPTVKQLHWGMGLIQGKSARQGGQLKTDKSTFYPSNWK